MLRRVITLTNTIHSSMNTLRQLLLSYNYSYVFGTSTAVENFLEELQVHGSTYTQENLDHNGKDQSN